MYWSGVLDDDIRMAIARISNYRAVSDVHRKWFTHKNPYGCWICDLLDTSEKLCQIVNRKYSEGILPSQPTDSHDSLSIE